MSPVPSTSKHDVFHFVMIKPTHYDDDGYPIQWLRSALPSNTLACLNGLAEDARRRQILGPSVALRLHTFDETNRRIRPERIIQQIEQEGGRGLIALVGVQSNQFPRALDLARTFCQARLPVCIGGFHVSGCLAMLPEMPPELRTAQELGISLFAGEAEEERLDNVLRDAWKGALQPIYNYLDAPPDLTDQPAPILPPQHIRRTLGALTSVDLGRGCPFKCSFCTIINVQGRKSRCRTPEALEAVIRDNYRRGINRFFITDDNLARNRNWEAFFDLLIRLREEEHFNIKFTIQVDTRCHQIPGFIDKAARAGVGRAFIGLENINPENLKAVNKSQNQISEYRTMLQMWKQRGVITYAGFIVGFPNDTRESILRDLETIKRELPVDILEVSFLTPLPGSTDHQSLYVSHEWMDTDLNKFDLDHRVTHHPVMSDDEWERVYIEAWRRFYSPGHMKTIIRRAGACGQSPGKIMFMMLWFALAIRLESVHAVEGGFFRLKFRRDRRPGLPIEPPLRFYIRYGMDIIRKHVEMAYWLIRMGWFSRRVKWDPNRQAYTDASLQPADADITQPLDRHAA
ncbi:MAG: radical SAM protein [Desulfobacterales bacterium]|nr:radical SAM protein [Desulfobacterales bacterium]MDJ0883795.1 radical SAM protein [Desulfobacterales bacterium]